MFKVYDSRDSDYKSPYGAIPQGTDVTFSFRPLRKWGLTSVTLRMWDDMRREMLEFHMRWKGLRGAQDLYQVKIRTEGFFGPLWYHFKMGRSDGTDMYYGNNLRCRGGVGETYDHDNPPGFQMTVYSPDYTVPDWYGAGVTYQIFPDRFHRLSKPDPRGMMGRRVVHDDWNDMPVFLPGADGEVKNNDFFGGSLAGVREKLPYLNELGVSTIYFNPIFEAASNHRYDTGDYMRIDPMLGTEKEFSELCKEARDKYGIRVILDGVFNHTGYDSRYFNGRGTYAEPGAGQSRDSRFYNWFKFGDWPRNYESWWGIYTLPRVDCNEPGYLDFIARGEDSVIRHWLRAGASGWRLDVADELTDEFIAEVRKALREECADGILIGEVWEDASSKVAYDKRRQYLLGSGLDSVMNYPFRNAVLAFLRGGDAREFVEDMEALRENYPKLAFMSLMNLIGTHDSARALTVLACDDADYSLTKSERAEKRLDPHARALGIARMKLAAAIQFSFPGSPLVYYGDEAYMEGFEDPFNRRGYPWGKENRQMLNWYRKLGNARRNSEALRYGDINYLYVKEGLLVYERVSEHETVTVAINRAMERMTCEVPWDRPLATDLMSGATLRSGGGVLRLELEPLTAMFLS